MNVLPTIRIDLDTVKRLARFAWQRSNEDRIVQVAGSLTFTTLLSLVPLATVAFVLFTAFPLFTTFQNSLQAFLADHLMPDQISSEIFGYLNEFSSKARGLTTMGLIGLFVTSVVTMMTVESAFNLIWRVRKARPLAQRVLVYWAILTLGPILIGVSLSVSSYVFTRSLVIATEQHVSGLFDWAVMGATLPFTALAFTLLYVYMPNCRVAWRDAVVGGVVAAIAFECAKRGFGFYVRRIPTYTAVYGAFATIPMFLAWLYLSWFITLAGAMIVSALPEIRTGRFDRPHFTGSDLLDALELLSSLAYARDEGQPGRTAEQLAQMLRSDLATVTRLLDDMEQDELVGRLENDGKQPHFVLLGNPAKISVARLYGRFVIDRKELAYQLKMKSSSIDADLLLDALYNEKLAVTLGALLAARRVHADDDAREGGNSRSSLPHPAS